MSGGLFVISGPSGAGKSTIIKALRERVPGLGFSVSHTSRPPRRGEVDGVHYRFVDDATFRRMIDEGAFVEWAEVYQRYYGTSYAALQDQLDQGLDVFLDIDPQGALKILKRFPESILVYVLPPSIEELERRLRGRATDGTTVIDARLRKAVDDIRRCTHYEYVVLNDRLEQALGELHAIVTAERCRLVNRVHQIEKAFHVRVANSDSTHHRRSRSDRK